MKSWPWEIATVLRQYGLHPSPNEFEASTSNFGPVLKTDVSPSCSVVT
jgi:hypothetical protein